MQLGNCASFRKERDTMRQATGVTNVNLVVNGQAQRQHISVASKVRSTTVKQAIATTAGAQDFEREDRRPYKT